MLAPNQMLLFGCSRSGVSAHMDDLLPVSNLLIWGINEDVYAVIMLIRLADSDICFKQINKQTFVCVCVCAYEPL